MEALGLPRPSGRGEVTQALMDAATILIAAHGVASVTTRQIARSAGVNQGLITRYFGTKGELVRQVANRIATLLFDDVEQRKLSLKDVLTRDLGQQRVLVRALLRIVIETESSDEMRVDQRLLARFFEWLESQQTSKGSAEAAEARLFLLTSLVLGSELVGPRVQQDLGLSNTGFQAMKERAFALLLNGVSASDT